MKARFQLEQADFELIDRLMRGVFRRADKPEPRTSERVVVDRPCHDGQTHHSPPNAPVIHWPQEPAR